MVALAALLLASLPTRSADAQLEDRVNAILAKMTLQEKLGQMSQTGIPRTISPELYNDIKNGRFGSLYGGGTGKTRALIQSAARASRLGIPLIIGEDVIHGYTTGWPIPLGQAATFDPDLVQSCARVTAQEASQVGIMWTFSPMMDIARDPRWGRIAEGYGEDPTLASRMAVATVRGYQGAGLQLPDSLAACGKHYVGYGAAEAGRDYNTTWIPENLLRDVYLKPFQASAAAGAASFMSAFNAINGVPASGNPLTLRQILRNEWGFDGMVVSDYAAVDQMIDHGYAADGADAARKAISAGVDMEMVSTDYWKYGAQLVRDGKLDPKFIDGAVRNILRTKFRLGLFDGRPQPDTVLEPKATDATMALSKKVASESLVLLKNAKTLPLASGVGKVAVIGPLADRPADQLGSWAHAEASTSITPLTAMRTRLGADRVLYAPGISFAYSPNRSYDENLADFLAGTSEDGFADAVDAAQKADVVVLFLGELSDLTGEASSRSALDLPGVQNKLVEAIAKLHKPTIGVVMAGRPLLLGPAASHLDALIFAWHPGPMAGPAIVDTLFGDNVPSGKLPVTFPRSVGQVPIYYAHLATGRPFIEAEFDHYTSRYIDIPNTPQYPFGFGLSYTTFSYSPTRVESQGDGFEVHADVKNTGSVDADEVVQFYTHQKAGDVARPVRELRDFRRVHLKAGETQTVRFHLDRSALAYWNQHMRYETEPGAYEAWIAPDAVSGVPDGFTVR